MTTRTTTRLLLLAGSLLLAAPCALAQHPGGGLGGAVGHVVGGGNGNPGNGIGAPPPPQVPSNGLMTGGHGGPVMGSRTPNSGNAPMIHSASPFGLSSRWWDDHKTARQLSLRHEQQQRMDKIFEANRNTLASLYTNLQTEEGKLLGLSAKDREDEAKVYAAIDRVTQARAQLQKTRQQIVVQLHQQLDAPQITLMEQASR